MSELLGPMPEEFEIFARNVELVIVYPHLGPDLVAIDLRKPIGPDQISVFKKTQVLNDGQVSEIEREVFSKRQIDPTGINLQVKGGVLREFGESGSAQPYAFTDYVRSLTEELAWLNTMHLFSSRFDVDSLEATVLKLQREALRRDLFTDSRETGGYKTIWPKTDTTP